MRIISGKYKGKNLIGFDIDGTRPTMDRVKESLFGIIQNYVKDSIVLDLFAGSGSLRIEALSNGALTCYFFDNNIEVFVKARDAVEFTSVAKVENIVKWAYKESKAGAVSDVYTIENGDESFFVIAALNKINPEGTASLEQVKPFIESTLFSEKLADNKLAEVTAKVNGMTDLKEIAKALGTTVSTKDGVAFSSFSSQGLDPKFIGAASASETGKIYGPVEGTIGVYVYKVTGRDTGAFYTEDDAKMADAQMTQYSTQMLLSVMMDDADVKDNRARFY